MPIRQASPAQRSPFASPSDSSPHRFRFLLLAVPPSSSCSLLLPLRLLLAPSPFQSRRLRQGAGDARRPRWFCCAELRGTGGGARFQVASARMEVGEMDDVQAAAAAAEKVISSRGGSVLGKKTILKSDHFPGCQNKRLTPQIDGAPNYRQAGSLRVHGVAMPTMEGIANVLNHIGAQKKGKQTRILWHSLREEPVIYINGRPFVLRDVERPFSNLEYTGINRERVEQMEFRLKEDILQEASRYGNKILVTDELPSGQMVDQWESVISDTVNTPLEVYEELQHQGYLVDYERVPITDEKAPKEGDFDNLVLDAFLAPGSELWMFNDVPEIDRERKLIDGGLEFGRLENITLVHREGNAVIRRHLESLPLESFDSILILADESVEDSAIQADSRSLATLLLIRDIQAKRLPYREAMVSHVPRGAFSEGSWIGEMQQASDKSVIISEILDPRTKNLLSMSKISDYVLSNELVSMALAMVAEDRQINDVLEELFAEQGNEMQIHPSDLYLREDEELNFFEIILRARQRKEIVIGYRLEGAERAIINPTDKVSRRRWSPKDVFVAIAEKE